VSLERPALSGFNHLSVSVTDLDRSLAFYRDVLGATVLAEPYDGTPQFDGRIALVLVGTVGLDLQEHEQNDGAPFDPVRTGLDHLGFNAASAAELDLWVRLLDEAGVGHSPIREAGPGLMFDFQDPDGIQLEFFFIDPDRPTTFTP